jgi:hypothetical protein
MKRRRLRPNVASTLLVPATVLAFASSHAGAAEPPECPPGEWFCDEPEEPELPPDGEVGPAEDSPPSSGSEWSDDARDAVPPRGAPRSEPADIDVRRRPPPEVLAGNDLPPRRRPRSSPWSVNLRIQGLMLGQGRGSSHDARMGGVGASIRYEVNPVLTLDGGIDSMLGRDYNGYDRSEVSLSLSSLLYLNQHPQIRTYGIFGLNTSAARVDVVGDDQAWGYFGAHAGLGLDIALDRRVALNVDLLGFLRGRTDQRAAREPEFTDGLGRVSNTSGGGLFRGGFTLTF